MLGDLRSRGTSDRQLRAPGQAPDCRKAFRRRRALGEGGHREDPREVAGHRLVAGRLVVRGGARPKAVGHCCRPCRLAILRTSGNGRFDELVARAAKAKCGEQVRAAALRFLETGDLAFSVDRVAKGGADASRRFRLAASDARLSHPAAASGWSGDRAARAALRRAARHGHRCQTAGRRASLVRQNA